MTQQSMAIQKHSLELWIELWIGTGKTIQCIPVHQVIQSLGPENSVALPLVHSYTGCDTSSSFLGIIKNTAWAAWEIYAELTETLIDLSEYSTLLTIHSLHMARLKRCTVRALDVPGCIMPGVNYLRMAHVCLTTPPNSYFP